MLFVFVYLLQSTLLPPPHGKCADKKLDYYYTYSHSHCEVECFTKFVFDICQCRDIYMPGKHYTA